jgi:replication factor C subunit 3/5
MPNRSDTIDVTVVTSAHHIEVNPSESGFYDRLVVQDVIKEIAMNQPLEVTRESRSFKVVIMNDADFLSKDAQQGLRRTMEKYMAYCRIILVAQSISKVIEAVRSRCLCLRVGAPTHAEIVQTLTNISTKEVRAPRGEV